MSSRLAGLFAGLTLLAGMSPVVAPEPALASSRVPAAGTPLPAGRQVKLLDLGQESVGAMMARERQAGPRGTPTALPPRLPANLGNLRPNPASRRLTATPDPQPASGTLSPRAAQTVGTQLLGATRADSPFIPPDTSGAVGPSQFIVMVNGRIRSFNKTTGAADGGIDMTTDTFWSPAGSTSDPRIRYDRLSGRWFVSMITVTTVGTANYVLSAYSDTNTITGGTFWRKVAYVVDTFHAGCLWDFDTLGIDQNALYIGGDLFCGTPTRSFYGANGLVIPKARLFGTTPSAYDIEFVHALSGCPAADGPLEPVGVDNYDPASTVGYFVGRASCASGELTFIRITNPGGTPSATLLKLSVPIEDLAVPVPAQGSTNPLEANDNRLSSAHLRNGHLWTTHNICVDTNGVSATPTCPAGARDGSRWYDIINLDTSPALNQSGTVFDPAATNPRFYWMPSIMVSGQGHVAMGTSAAGSTEFAEAATMGRLAGDALGTMQAATIYQTSTFAYNIQTAPKQRWGDYSYTSLDPSDDMTMWTIQEFTNATNSWGVEAVQLKAPPPAMPSGVDDTTLFTNQCSQTIKVTGTSTSGSGFFDPGPGFPNHMQGSSSGGVTVNRVTYIDPTHIIVDVSTQGAATGLKDLTVTNPDGQSVTVPNFLNVTGASTQPDTMTASSLTQYSLSNSDGVTWQEIDPSLRVSCTPVANQSTLLGGNADLWTGSAGINQDIGIFVSDNGGTDALLAWKESGSFATSSPNAAYVQWLYPMLSGHSYVFKLKWKANRNAPGAFIAASAGLPGNHSPTSLVAETFPTGTVPNFVNSLLTSQYQLNNSDGTTWQPMDNTLLTTTLSPVANSTAVLGANSDLWTGSAGFNQDIGIFVRDSRTFADGATTNGSTTITSPASAQFSVADIGGSISGAGIPASTTITAVTNATTATISQAATATASGVAMTIAALDKLVAWKESGGSGTSSPNAAFVKATYPMVGGHTYVFRLKWKTGTNAPGTFIAAGAGISPNFSPTSLVVQSIPSGANPYHKEPNNQYSLSNSDGATWQPIDLTPALDVTVAPGSHTNCILGANADLWTGSTGFNQDLAIFVSDNGGADTLVAWKESGGFATSSPNAAFAQATYTMSSGHTYVFKLKWKTGTSAPGTFIAAGAGVPGGFSPIRLTVELTN